MKDSEFVSEFFDKIYVINLFDRPEKYKKVAKQFKKNGIKNVQRFVTVDGRCGDQGISGFRDKLQTFEIMYDVKITNSDKKPLKELLPASSLTISTILLLRHMVKNKLSHILICEDDIILSRNFSKKFVTGITDLYNSSKKKATNWDILYLGCGNRCGINDISEKETKEMKKSKLGEIYGLEYYTKDPLDLRSPCYKKDCDGIISSSITVPEFPGGSWCYAFSYKGAKKFLKLFDNEAGVHVDWIFQNFEDFGGMKLLAFDPPIAMHDETALNRGQSSIPWKF